MGPLRSGNDGLPGCRGRKGERAGYAVKLAPLWWASGVQDIADKDVETEERCCDEKDDEGREQQESPGRRYYSDESGDGD